MAQWSASSGLPLLQNLADLQHSPAFHGTVTSLILLNLSAKTALAAAHGDWAPVATALHTQAVTSLADLTTALNTHLRPYRAQPFTRSKHWRNWAAVVMWAIAWGATGHILPAHTDTLKALTWELPLAPHLSSGQPGPPHGRPRHHLLPPSRWTRRSPNL